MDNLKVLLALLLVLLSFMPAPVQAQMPQERELVVLRTENSKTFDVGGGQRRAEVHIGAIHYRDDYSNPNEQWKDIDLTWVGNYIGTAPYELWKSGSMITVKDKKTGSITTLELLGAIPAGMPWEIIPEYTRIKFQHVLPIDRVPFEAKFRVVGNTPIRTRAFDDVGDIELETTLIDGVLTERLTGIKDKLTGQARAGKGKVRVDPSIELQVNASLNDAGGRFGFLHFDNAWTVNPAGAMQDYYKHYSGMRFAGVNLSQGALLTAASIIFTAGAEAYSGTGVKSNFSADDTDNAAAFSTSDDFTTRWNARTTAKVSWDDLPPWVLETEYTGPDISSVVQEIVDRAGWVSGNAIAIFWDDREDRSAHVNGNLRYAHSYDSSTTKAPKLSITYIAAPTVVTNNASGITDVVATLAGNITDTGGQNASQRGFEWDTNSGVPYANNWTELGSYSTGNFTHEITGLVAQTQYFYRAKAYNSAGVGYGSEYTFTTLLGLPLAPTNFTVVRNGLGQVAINWTLGQYANTTLVRVKEDGPPKSVTDGYLVYNSTANNLTYTGLNLNFGNYFFRAWSYNPVGFSTDSARASIGGSSMLTLGFIGIALFFTWFSHKRGELLISIVSFLLWFSMGLWLFFSDEAPFDLNQGYTQMLTYTFFILSFVPLIFAMNTEIKHEAKGKSWSTYGSRPKAQTSTGYEAYKEELQRRMDKHRRRR